MQRTTVLSHKAPESKVLSITKWKLPISSTQNSSFTQKVPNEASCPTPTLYLFLIQVCFCAEQEWSSIQEREMDSLPRGGGRPLMLPGPPGCCPGGLHLLASWVAVAWVPKLHLLHLLPKHKISSDFVSFPLVPT